MSEQNSYSGLVDASTTANIGLGYLFNNGIELRSDIYNLADTYYEYKASYPENGRIVTATLKYNF